MTRWTWVVIAAAVMAAPEAVAQGVSKPRRDEVLLLTRTVNTTVAAAAYAGVQVGARSMTVAAVTTHVSVVSGGGAGSTVFRLADGTNTCDCALTCVASQGTGAKRATCSGGCTFPPAALVTMSVASTTCTTNQPAVYTIDARGYMN